MDKPLAPVVMFVYNRPAHTKNTLEALRANTLAKETDLFVFSDAAKNETAKEKVQEVRTIIASVEGFRSVTVCEAPKNKGLARSIIDGVTQIINRYGCAIVLEDDLTTSPMFLKYMNDALRFYEADDRIWSIAGYNYPMKMPEDYKESVYFFYRASSWGWASWKDRWNSIDWNIEDFNSYKWNPIKIAKFCKGGTDLDKMLRSQMTGKSDSWAIRWCYNQSKQGKYTVYPCVSLVSNDGIDGSGTHCDTSANRFNTQASEDFSYEFKYNLAVNKDIVRRFRKMVDRSPMRRIKRILSGRKNK